MIGIHLFLAATNLVIDHGSISDLIYQHVILRMIVASCKSAFSDRIYMS